MDISFANPKKWMNNNGLFQKSEWISVCSKTNQTSLIMKLFPPHIAILSEMAAWCQTESNLKLSNSISLFRSLQLLYIFQVLSITNSISFPSHHQYLIWAKWSDSERQKLPPQVPSTVARRRNEKHFTRKLLRSIPHSLY